mgnify:CR=1 FL=1
MKIGDVVTFVDGGRYAKWFFGKIAVVENVSINSKGEIFIQESKVEYEKIIAKVLAVSKNRTDTRIYVRGDKTINYGRVLEIMGLLSGSGFTKVALISEPYKER